MAHMSKPIQMGSLSKMERLIKRLPKTDLHLHLDGSVRLNTIAELARENGVKIPSYDAAGLEEKVFKDQYQNLEEYLTTFAVSCAVMQTPESLERIAYELAVDNQQEGVRYIEVRFAPQLHVNKTQDIEQVFKKVWQGLERAKTEFNQKPEIQNGSEPAFHYGIISSAMRHFGPWSYYNKNFINSFPYSTSKQVGALASLELAKATVNLRQKDYPIVGFDLCGPEAGNPAGEHRKTFQYAHDHFLSKTVHAGEAYGPESIFQAITDLHADRIGHGYFLFNTDKIKDSSIENKQSYVDSLIRYIAENRIMVEVCLTSNLQTNPDIQNIADHNFKKMLAAKLSTTICTDNRTVSKTTVTKELMLALQGFDITPRQLKNLLIYGFKRSFFPAEYPVKRAYIRQCIDYYDKIIEEEKVFSN